MVAMRVPVGSVEALVLNSHGLQKAWKDARQFLCADVLGKLQEFLSPEFPLYTAETHELLEPYFSPDHGITPDRARCASRAAGQLATMLEALRSGWCYENSATVRAYRVALAKKSNAEAQQKRAGRNLHLRARTVDEFGYIICRHCDDSTAAVVRSLMAPCKALLAECLARDIQGEQQQQVVLERKIAEHIQTTSAETVSEKLQRVSFHLQGLTVRSILELRSFRWPPSFVETVLEIVQILLGYRIRRPYTWQQAQVLMGRDFLQCLRDAVPDESPMWRLRARTAKVVCAQNTDILMPGYLLRISVAASTMAAWASEILETCDLMQCRGKSSSILAEFHARLDKSQRMLALLEQRLAAVASLPDRGEESGGSNHL